MTGWDGPPLVSVITPVHNGEPHLAQCIESVLAQTYERWEYIIVDNASSDSTYAIACRYAENDKRIQVYRNETLVSAPTNHNIGLARIAAESVYVKFVQADDWLFPSCLGEMVQVAEANPTVGVVGAYRLDDTRVNLDGLPFPSTVVPGRDICRATLLGLLYVFGSPTSLLMRSELVRRRQPLFDDKTFPRHSDTAACYELLRDSDFGFVHQVLTYTRRSADSRTSLSKRLNSYRVEQLVALALYGPVFLKPTEYARRRRERTKRYYAFLARNLHRRDGVFWDYHRQRCEALGLPLSRRRLVIPNVAAALDRLALPVRKLYRRLASKPTASQ